VPGKWTRTACRIYNIIQKLSHKDETRWNSPPGRYTQITIYCSILSVLFFIYLFFPNCFCLFKTNGNALVHRCMQLMVNIQVIINSNNSRYKIVCIVIILFARTARRKHLQDECWHERFSRTSKRKIIIWQLKIVNAFLVIDNIKTHLRDNNINYKPCKSESNIFSSPGFTVRLLKKNVICVCYVFWSITINSKTINYNNNNIYYLTYLFRNCLCSKMTLAKMDQRFQLISHHRDDKQTEPPRALNPVINNSKPNKVSSEIVKISRTPIFYFVRLLVFKCSIDLNLI